MPPNVQMLSFARAADRIAAARQWLESLAPGTESLVIAPSPEAADELLRTMTVKRGSIFGIHRLTLNRLIGVLSAPYLFEHGLAPASGLAGEAVAARAAFRLRGDAGVDYFAPLIDRPGFPGALARTLGELRLAGITPDDLQRLDERCAVLAPLLAQFERELQEAKLVDRCAMLAAAQIAVERDAQCRFAGMPTLIFDVRVDSVADRDFLSAIARRSPSVLAVVAAGDERSAKFLTAALGVAQTIAVPNAEEVSLVRLQHHLFATTAPPAAPLDDTVVMRSAAGEMQECVEIARRIHLEARRGVPFDRVAVLLHAPARYASHLEEALNRAGIPAWFARGTSRPEPGGRALLALLNCAAEGFSARRFAEYLSLAQVPDDVTGASAADAERFVRPHVELAAAPLRHDLEVPPAVPELERPQADPLPVTEGTVRAPWKWEQLLVDAAVVGGRDRWQARLDGLAAELGLRRRNLEDDDPRARGIDRTLLDLGHLREVALPIIGALVALPFRAAWSEWLAHLRALVRLAIRDDGPVLASLGELEPMGPIGPITLDEVQAVLSERLGRLEAEPARRRYGAVFIASTSHARGLDFDVTLIPGLAERLFPKKLTEDPLLPDAVRQQLGRALEWRDDRVTAERLALRLAAGAACKRAVFSYPRVDLDQGRPRVPSFYALEVLRAAEGRLPGFDELARRAAGDRITRLGWPAPEKSEDAIDEVEYDLAVLDRLLDADPDTTVGAAHYLLDANPHLGRALRARARRWLRRWTSNDGLVELTVAEHAALARHQLSARSYSPTALQNFAACPYRFFQQAILRLEPRDELGPIESIDPLTRGGLFHEVQFETLSALRTAGDLPVTNLNLDAAYAEVEHCLEMVAERYHDELAPSIERVWLDGIESVRADLREWVRRMAESRDGFVPERFELAFGLSDRPQADPASVSEPVRLAEGLMLRGSIDLVERGSDGNLRVTDHKTGRVRADRTLVIGGGKTLQPVLYALAAERILNQSITAGRLYYCTAAGGYEDRSVALDAAARSAIVEFARVLGTALHDGFLPAAPGNRECEYCDYRAVCGPYEEIRLDRKLKSPGVRASLADLARLREMR